ncbi:MAG: hypothetical protein V8T90_13610 [Victivallales bacterium]
MRIHFRAMFDKITNDFKISGICGMVERDAALPVRGVDIRAGINQEFCDLRMSYPRDIFMP